MSYDVKVLEKSVPKEPATVGRNPGNQGSVVATAAHGAYTSHDWA